MTQTQTRRMKKNTALQIVLGVFILALLGYDLMAGLSILSRNVSPTFDSNLFFQLRLPRVLGAVLAGISLAWSGLLMQTLFRNPLAGPFLIGITPGASFGIAVLTFFGGYYFSDYSGWGVSFQPIAALLGALMVMGIQLWLHKRLQQLHSLLLLGLVLGYFFGAAVDIIEQMASAQQVKQFVLWGMGNFDRIEISQLFPFAAATFFGGAILWYNRHSFNTYLLGDIYVLSSGKSTHRLRFLLIVSSAVMAALATAYCGPVSFVGLIAPHLSRRISGTESHSKNILPTALCGILLTLTGDLLSHNLFQNFTLPINAMMAIIGAPLVFYIIRKVKY